MKRRLVTATLALCCLAAAQTQVDLRRQSKAADLSQAGPTKPAQTGSSLPVHCEVGELFFLTTAQAGSNLYGCNAVDTWSGQASGGLSLPPRLEGSKVLMTDSALDMVWGDLMPGAGLARTQVGSVMTWSADSTMVAYLALDNAFLGNNAFAGRTTLVPGVVQTLAPADTIDVGLVTTKLIGAGSALTLMSAPTIAAGDDGQQVYLLNAGVNAITLQDGTQMAGSGLCLSGRANVTLGAKSAMHLFYSGASGCWVQVGGAGAGQQRDFDAASCQGGAAVLGWNTVSGSAPAAGCMTGANGVVYGVAKFANSGTREMQQSLDLPAGASSVTFDVAWRAASASGSVAWVVKSLVVAADGTGADDPALGSATVVASPAVAAVAGRMMKSTVTVAAGASGPRRLYFTVARTYSVNGDTFTHASNTPELARVTVKVQ